MKITVEIPDEIVAGITAARTAFNDSQPDVNDEKGNSVDPKPGTFDTDDDYFAARVVGMVQSWADQHGVSPESEVKAKAEFLAKLRQDKRKTVGAAIDAAM